jgi:hypothetical protein
MFFLNVDLAKLLKGQKIEVIAMGEFAGFEQDHKVSATGKWFPLLRLVHQERQSFSQRFRSD